MKKKVIPQSYAVKKYVHMYGIHNKTWIYESFMTFLIQFHKTKDKRKLPYPRLRGFYARCLTVSPHLAKTRQSYNVYISYGVCYSNLRGSEDEPRRLHGMQTNIG